MPRPLRLGLRGRVALALVLTLGPTLILAYFAYQAVRDREQSLRVTHTATAILVRDQVLGELGREESLIAEAARKMPLPADIEPLQRWLKSAAEQPHTGTLFSIPRADALVTAGGWADPGSLPSSLAETALRKEAEDAEFRQGNLELALRLYRNGSHAGSASERAFALIREARTLAKLNRLDESLATYRRVVTLFPELLDSHGIPVAASALFEIVDGLTARERAPERQVAVDELTRYLLAHPWDVGSGYGYCLRRALTLLPGPDVRPALTARAESISLIEWLMEVRPHIDRVMQVSVVEGGWNAVAGRRAGKPWTVLVHAVSRAGQEGQLMLGVACDSEELSGRLLAKAVESAPIGPDTRAGLRLDGVASLETPLAVVELGSVLPGWSVEIRDVHGRSVEQLVRRERWAYGGMVAGVFTVLVAGVVFMIRGWARQTELARLQSEFVSNVSHELKTPLALIRMFGETLESGIVSDPARRQEFYGVIRRESERLTHLINNVLDTAKIDAGTRTLTCTQGDIVPLVREALDAYAPLFARMNFTVESDLPEASVLVTMDRDAVAQALVNLFQNVIRYSSDNRHVRIGVAGGDHEVSLSVSDRGVGIPAAELPRIFDKFYRGPGHGEAAASSGSGLGLAIVKYVMSAHGGRVDVRSVVGEGSVFTLVFPAVRAS